LFQDLVPQYIANDTHSIMTLTMLTFIMAPSLLPFSIMTLSITTIWPFSRV
jgi:hypothetical protein